MIQSTQNSIKAEAIAEAAVEEAMWEYNYGGMDFATGDGWSLSGTTQSKATTLTDTLGSNVGTYTISVASFNTAPAITIAGSVTGVPGTGTQATVMSRIQGQPVYSAAVKAKGLVSLSGNAYSNSYDSSDGTYGGSNISQNGDIVTNSSATPAITVTGNAHIDGDAGTGTAGSITVNGNGAITGLQGSGVNNTFTDNSGSAYTGLPSSGMFVGSGNGSSTINNTTLRYTSFGVSGNYILNITGNVTLYLTSTTGNALSTSGNGRINIASGATLTVVTEGNVSLSGNGIVNNNGSTNPISVQLLGTPTCTSVSITGNGALAGVINTPQAHVNVSGNGAYYGAIIADRFTNSGNGGIHYDENLANTGPSSGYGLQWIRRA